jgi:plastocyanin
VTRALRLTAIALSLATAVSLTGCGDDGKDTDATGTPSTTAPAASGDVVEIRASEALKFDPTTIPAKVGEAFHGKLIAVGSIPHNIEIKDLGVKGADTMVSGDGDSKEFSFTADKAGSYDYLCTIHPATMKGTVTVS